MAQTTPPKWTGDLIGRMHNAGVDRVDIAEYMGVTKSYITAILNGRKTPPNAKERLNTAFAEVVASKPKTEY